ncbi:MAG: methyltransferase [Bradymonadia bacterium]
MSISTCAEALSAGAALLDEVADVLAERVLSAEPPAWAVARGWDTWLAQLSPAVLDGVERDGLTWWAGHLPDAPESLVDLCHRVRSLMLFPKEPVLPIEPDAPMKGASVRKQAQVRAFVHALQDRDAASGRIVDIGSGHGHLTRTLSDALGCRALGLEAVEQRVWRAQALAEGDARVEFAHVDALKDQWPLEAGDVVVGLHACGRLGDAAVEAVGDAPEVSLALVGCCAQKMHTCPRHPRSSLGKALGIDFEQPLLSFANFALPTGVSLEEVARGRAWRHGLEVLLRGRGLDVDVVSAPRGVSRRAMQHSFERAARVALERRGLPPATEAELTAAEAEGATIYAAVRRWSQPRRMLSRVIELVVALDRICALEEQGRPVEIMYLFPQSISPRNILIWSGARP